MEEAKHTGTVGGVEDDVEGFVHEVEYDTGESPENPGAFGARLPGKVETTEDSLPE